MNTVNITERQQLWGFKFSRFQVWWTIRVNARS